MTDHEELLARIRERLFQIENELASEKTPGEIKSFAHCCLRHAMGSLEMFSMFERTLWVADGLVHLHNKAEATKLMPTPIIMKDPDQTGGGS